jgi:hypothetical protein
VTAACVHHWIVESPNATARNVLIGVCKRCGEDRRFTSPEGSWDWNGQGIGISAAQFSETRPHARPAPIAKRGVPRMYGDGGYEG